jgi:hypothetical protein
MEKEERLRQSQDHSIFCAVYDENVNTVLEGWAPVHAEKYRYTHTHTHHIHFTRGSERSLLGEGAGVVVVVISYTCSGKYVDLKRTKQLNTL